MLDLLTTPYSWSETLGMIKRRFSPPPPRHGAAARAQHRLNGAHSVEEWYGFVGDISPLQGRKVRYGSQLKQFFADCRRVAGNLEGVITDQPWFPYLHNHGREIFPALGALVPLDRWVLSVANNHAMDYGPRALRRTTHECRRKGIPYLGTLEAPRVKLHDDVTLTSWTWWVNRRGEGVARDDPREVPEAGVHIAFPHWGYEHERRPRTRQREQIPGRYSAVVGHHSHLPQPLEITGDGRPVAWSLGNFITAKQLPVLGEGAVVKLGITRSSGTARIVEAAYRQITISRPLNDSFCTVRLRTAGEE